MTIDPIFATILCAAIGFGLALAATAVASEACGEYTPDAKRPGLRRVAIWLAVGAIVFAGPVVVRLWLAMVAA